MILVHSIYGWILSDVYVFEDTRIRGAAQVGWSVTSFAAPDCGPGMMMVRIPSSKVTIFCIALRRHIYGIIEACVLLYVLM